ncbi:hemicentin-2-like isoform X2 [Dreissena polymorpha]|uniref:hemicentin-2-like isoform X2 n=1 Tax=Dreissena polymorpha TaxID=45954 RepID=UPI002263C0A7|nr:hemicentin-2-like isoform X2 [Dreissena polymorpha]
MTMWLHSHGASGSDYFLRTFLQCVLVAASVLSVARGAIEWVQQPTDRNITIGGDVTFPCEIRYRNQAATLLMWTKGGAVIFANGNASGSQVPSRYSVDFTESGRNNLHISNVQLEDDSYYNCQIFSFDTIQVKLNVNVPPNPPTFSINSTEPFVENSVILLTCSSSGGKPTPTIQWLRNGQPVNSAIVTLPSEPMGVISSRLTVNLTRSDHRANYSCVVFNAANQNNPHVSPKILNVQYSPSISFTPTYSPYRTKQSSRVTITCLVDANPAYESLTWYKNNIAQSVQSTTLTFPSVKKEDQGTYTCKAANRVSGQRYEVNASVVLDVLYPPVVTAPSSVIKDISEQVNLSCAVISNPPPMEVRWDKIGESISYNGPNFVFSASKTFAGNYSCTARNRLEPSDGSAEDVLTKGYTTLWIRYQPSGATIQPIAAVNEGQSLTLTCSLSEPGYPAPEFRWWRAETPGSVIHTSPNPTFMISQTRLADNGNYTCQASNEIGVGAPSTVTVEVNAAPVFVGSMPSDGSLTVPITQSNVVLEHRIEGRPKPVVTWFKDSVPISSLTNLYTEITESSYSQFKYTVTTRIRFIGSDRDQNRLQSDDIGNYTCVVSSAATPQPKSQNIRLSVEFEPLIKSSARVAAQLGEKTTLTCIANANPPPTFFWSQNGQVLANTSGRFQRQELTGVIAQYRGILEIQSVTAGDFGQYDCQVTNNKGQTSASVQLSRKSTPEQPSDVISLERTWESVQLQWTPGFNGGFVQAFFIMLQSVYGNKTVEVYPQNVTKFNITRLMPQTSYTFSVYGNNVLGKGAYSVPFTAQTEVLVFPALNKVPEFKVEDKKLLVPNDLNQSYCLRVEVSNDNRRTWTVIEPCIAAEAGEISLDRPGATDVNVSICLVYRPDVCGEPVSNEASTPDLTKDQVIIIGCVCAAILTILLVILVVILCRRKQKNKSNHTNDPHTARTVQQGSNGVLPHQKTGNNYNSGTSSKPLANGRLDNIWNPSYSRTNDSTTNTQTNFVSYVNLGTIDRYANVSPQYFTGPGNYPAGDNSYESPVYDDQYEYEMNRRNANLGGNSDQYYNEKQADASFSGSPRTPTKDPRQFISLPEDHVKEGGSFGSGNESGYSTPDKIKPKKVIYEVVV